MKKILKIAIREFKTYFHSLIGPVILALFLAVLGLFFVSYVDIYIRLTLNVGLRETVSSGYSINEVVIESLFWLMNFLLLFFVPLITMRLFAEEKRNKTLTFLISSPISINQLFFGKFLGAFLFFLVMFFMSFMLVLSLIMYGNPDIGPIIMGYLGLMMVAMAYISIGLFFSAITEHQIISAVITFFLLFSIYVLAFVLPEGKFSKVGEYLSTATHIESFFKGVFKTKDIAYFMLVFLLGWLLTYRQLESIRWKA
jgi:ABC-2 type transport system permease protein